MSFLAVLVLLPILGFGQTEEMKGKVLDLVAKIEDMQPAKVTDMRVEETATGFRVEVAADVLFDFDRATIKPEAEPSLKQVAAMIAGKSKGSVRIEGHTDGKGSKVYNQKLSLDRAESVRNWLSGQGGIERARLTAVGMGASKPIAPNTKPGGGDDPVGRQRNRRVEITISK